MALTWDFERQISPGADPGNTVGYFDTSQQAFYTFNGQIYTQAGEVDSGQWQDTPRGVEIEEIISDTGYSVLDIEHNFNGAVFGSVQKNADVVFIYYENMVDVSTWLDSGDLQLQADNPIKAGGVTLVNKDSKLFDESVYSILAPGSIVRLNFYSGDSGVFPLGMFFVETSPYTVGAQTIAIDGRNRIGYQLATQTLDELATISGTRTYILTSWLLHAGVPASAMLISEDLTEESLILDPSKTVLSAIDELLDPWGMVLDDLPDGTIVIKKIDGELEDWSELKKNIYSFDEWHDLKTRSITRSSSGVFSRVAVKRDGDTPRTVYAPVACYDGWYISGHRTFYHSVPDAATDETMDEILSILSTRLQFSGIVETFTGIFRPHLQVGDVAISSNRVAGIMTEVKHSFGRVGFYTDFTVTSGGKIMNLENPLTLLTDYMRGMSGANREKRLIDYLISASKK